MLVLAVLQKNKIYPGCTDNVKKINTPYITITSQYIVYYRLKIYQDAASDGIGEIKYISSNRYVQYV